MAFTELPLPDELFPEKKPATLAEIQLDERHHEFAAKRWPEATDRMREYRVKQVIWAKFKAQMTHPDDPTRKLWGGRQPAPGTRQAERKITARQTGRMLVEEMSKREKEIKDAFFAPMAPGNKPMDRHKAAMNAHRIQVDMAAMDMLEEEHESKSAAQVDEELTDLFVQLIKSGKLDLNDLGKTDDVVDAEVVEQPELGS